MNSCSWRIGARVVGYIDLILSSVTLLIAIAIIISVSPVLQMSSIRGKPTANDVEYLHVPSVIVWIVVATLGILTFVRLWAAIALLQATNLETQLKGALGKARFWRNVTIIFLVMFVTICIIFMAVTIALGSAVFIFIIVLFVVVLPSRLAFIFVVYKFIKGREQAIIGIQDTESYTN